MVGSSVKYRYLFHILKSMSMSPSSEARATKVHDSGTKAEDIHFFLASHTSLHLHISEVVSRLIGIIDINQLTF